MRWLLPLALLPLLYAQPPDHMFSGDLDAEDSIRRQFGGDLDAEDKHRRQKTSKMLGQCPDGHQTLKDIPILYGLHGIQVKDPKDWNDKDKALAKLRDAKEVVLGTDALRGGEPRFQPTCLTCGYYYNIFAVPDYDGSWHKMGKKFSDFKTEFSPLTFSVPFAATDNVFISVSLTNGKVESESVTAALPAADADEWIGKVHKWLEGQGYSRDVLKDLRTGDGNTDPRLSPFLEQEPVKGDNAKFLMTMSAYPAEQAVDLSFNLIRTIAPNP